MRLNKILKLSVNMLVHSKLRSWLTIIGIFIGVAAVVAIISLGEGLQNQVQSQITGLGQDILTISSGSQRAFGGGEGREAAVSNPESLSDKDLLALKLVPGIKAINSIVSGRASVKYQSETASISLQGVDVSVMKEFITTDLDSGRFPTQGETKSIVVGYGVANSVFKNKLNVGYLLTLNDKPFRIVGILASSSGFGSTDNSIYMSSKDTREVLASTITLNSDEYSSINVKVTDPDNMNETSNKISAALRNSHHVLQGKEDFSISSPQALQQRFSSITSGITMFLALLAAVSLFVGSIGVANTMFTSVLEKTRDIGVMKAIGAKNRDILLIFLINSGLLGLVGGILGVLFGAVIAINLPNMGLGISLPGARGGLQSMTAALNFNLIFFSLLFSMLIGMVSGAIPAYRASKLKPIEALRYE